MCVSFTASPGVHASAYELSGIAGETAIRGLGVALLMRSAAYPAVIVNPDRFRPLYAIILMRQLIGFIGASWVHASLPAGHVLLQADIGRFIALDGCGLTTTGVAFAWLTLCRHKAKEEHDE